VQTPRRYIQEFVSGKRRITYGSFTKG
jgi:hypothetical protein